MTTSDQALVQVDPNDIILADPEQASAALQHLLASGDYSRLTDRQRAALYLDTCASLGINPRTRPLDWIEFYDPEIKGKKLTLYPNKTCFDQLARQHQIRIRTVEEKIVGSLFKVVVEGTMPDGRSESNVAYLDLTDRDGNPLKGQKLGNAYMKCHTKAKRRLVFGMIGLMAPPFDVEDGPRSRVVTVDGNGRILRAPTEEQRYLAENADVAAVLREPTYETTASASESPLAEAASQAATPEELTPPARPYSPPARFHCDAERWQKTWFMLVRDTPLEWDEARHDFVQWFTSSWPENRRTSSFSEYLSHATDRQAEALVNGAREWLAEQAAAAPPAVRADERDAVEYPDRPLDGVEYNAGALRSFYRAWTDALKSRDTAFIPLSSSALMKFPADALRDEIAGLIGQCESIDVVLMMADEADVETSEPSPDDEPPF